MLNGKKILLGVTGGIAAYKAAALCSQLVKAGADVHVIMTESALRFIPALTLQVLTRNDVYTDTFDERNPKVVNHIDLADKADLVLIAPATANIIGKLANGIADDMLSTTLLAVTAPVMIAPAMNVHMYSHPAVVHNMRVLTDRGVMMIEPGSGMLACGYVGKGRLEEPETIVEVVRSFFGDRTANAAGAFAAASTEPSIETQSEFLDPGPQAFPIVSPEETAGADGVLGIGSAPESAEEAEASSDALLQRSEDRPLAGKKIVVTAGGTIERIDPVRYITNDSSGKMGAALAMAARDMGAQVKLIAGKVQIPLPAGIETIRIESAEDMYEACLNEWPNTDVLIMSAAIADYRPKSSAPRKIKKLGDTMSLQLVKTVDVLQTLGAQKEHQFLIGFAAETHDLDVYAAEKLQRKNCDLLVANDVTQTGAGFGSDTNIVRLFGREGEIGALPKQSKYSTAREILLEASRRMSEGALR
ncbi:bifunctional phosphopantothenoylcysteine decarboxylase/phosphopantothenate--cysteine ligase CoaBC [Saccharibacillus sp. CPCC 101409]|uniref:bifunctional phosphopantothenoylcysteine decarboxylase/phosphopantothenate--cysteine ligase CoaBC n=1 Tax=Saccharibacillus sp. CPCC 101409 TaxID=3058041 RepID=UPI002671A1D1|nr:bifunctional phosphopantothenoylcysteine decarboxylase/phosphopantothenate--cysteine ligase CoaBC [Saccharibacillus sp. CPCC 101409]MDO3409374.1 bifunctional phosphopantothenoylcysteine decarboxylase/phosphopantothenate--cysteine ligase CoaBC [Saccharibacillus sp. CPCC 101409]